MSVRTKSHSTNTRGSITLDTWSLAASWTAMTYFVCAAALETNKGKAAFKLAFNNVIQQTAPGTRWATDLPPSAAEPCLQAADYCAWAIQRKWKMGDMRSYELIESKIATEFDLWRRGTTYHYE
jgi:hypothetical protein